MGYLAALDELYGLGFDHYKSLEQEVEAVTADDVKRVAAKYFQKQAYVLATVRPPDNNQIETGVKPWPKSKPAPNQASSRSASSSS